MGGFGVTGAVPDDFADRVKSLRGQLALTQTQLAARLGVSFATVNRWENAQARLPSLASLPPLRRLWTSRLTRRSFALSSKASVYPMATSTIRSLPRRF